MTEWVLALLDLARGLNLHCEYTPSSSDHGAGRSSAEYGLDQALTGNSLLLSSSSSADGVSVSTISIPAGDQT